MRARSVSWLLPLLGACSGGAAESTEPAVFHWVAFADTHVIDEHYMGREGTALDTETILHANARFARTVDKVNALPYDVAFSAVVGDVIHHYPSNDIGFYYEPDNRPAIDLVKGMLEQLDAPVHVGLGNHDYNVPETPREDTHRLFRDKLGIEPYYSFDVHGWRFVHLNSQLGNTWTRDHPDYDKSYGSLGAEQLRWFDGLLQDGFPTVAFVHHHPFVFATGEDPEGRYPDLDALRARYPNLVLVVSGHLHRWVDFEDGRLIIGSTRFDEDAFFVFEAEVGGSSYRILNYEQAHWMTDHPDGFKGTIDPFVAPDEP